MQKAKYSFSRRLVITIFKGSERLLTKAFVQGPVVIGRQPGCDFILEYPFISRTHCQFVEEAEIFYIVDLGSRNGFLVEGKRAAKHIVSDDFSFEIEDLRIEAKLIGELASTESHKPDTKMTQMPISRRKRH